VPIVVRSFFGFSQALFTIFGYVWVTTYASAEQEVLWMGSWQATSVLASVVGYGTAFACLFMGVKVTGVPPDTNAELLQIKGMLYAWRVPFCVQLILELLFFILALIFVPHEHFNIKNVDLKAHLAKDMRKLSVASKPVRRSISVLSNSKLAPRTETEDEIGLLKDEIKEDQPLDFSAISERNIIQPPISMSRSLEGFDEVSISLNSVIIPPGEISRCASRHSQNIKSPPTSTILPCHLTRSNTPSFSRNIMIESVYLSNLNSRVGEAAGLSPSPNRNLQRSGSNSSIVSEIRHEGRTRKLSRYLTKSQSSLFDDGDGGSCVSSYIRVLKNPIFVVLVLGTSGLFYVVSGIQYWVTLYLMMKFPGQESLIRGFFIVIATTGPIIGLIIGSLSGSYVKTEDKDELRLGYVNQCLVYGCLAGISSLGAMYFQNLYLICFSAWLILLFGGAILPLITTAILGGLEDSDHTTGASLSTFSQNIFGWGLSCIISGYFSTIDGAWAAVLWGAWVAWGILVVGWVIMMNDRRKRSALQSTEDLLRTKQQA